MIFELPDIFFGSHKKRKGITTTAGETVRIYKKGRKSLTTSGFFKKSGDIFFGATSHQNRHQTVSVFLLFIWTRNLDSNLHRGPRKGESLFGERRNSGISDKSLLPYA